MLGLRPAFQQIAKGYFCISIKFGAPFKNVSLHQSKPMVKQTDV